MIRRGRRALQIVFKLPELEINVPRCAVMPLRANAGDEGTGMDVTQHGEKRTW
jgi:hypothetical protein